MTGCIVGWAHSKFGRHDDRDVESLIVEVAQGALADAGVSGADIDAVYLGTMNGGFVKQEFPASLVFQADPELRQGSRTPVPPARRRSTWGSTRSRRGKGGWFSSSASRR
jgi:acetyl-CoA C-acetyltransferase